MRIINHALKIFVPIWNEQIISDKNMLPVHHVRVTCLCTGNTFREQVKSGSLLKLNAFVNINSFIKFCSQLLTEQKQSHEHFHKNIIYHPHALKNTSVLKQKNIFQKQPSITIDSLYLLSLFKIIPFVIKRFQSEQRICNKGQPFYYIIR